MSRLLHGYILCCTGLSPEERASAQQIVHIFGGTWSRHLTGRVTHLILKNRFDGSEKLKMSLKLKLSLVHYNFLLELNANSSPTTITLGQLAQILDNHRVKIFTGATICVTGLCLEMRESLKNLCELEGAIYSSDLTKSVTHLLSLPNTEKTENSNIDAYSTSKTVPLKIQYAQKWHIPILQLDWFHQSVQAGYLIAMDNYYIKDFSPESQVKAYNRPGLFERLESGKSNINILDLMSNSDCPVYQDSHSDVSSMVTPNIPIPNNSSNLVNVESIYSTANSTVKDTESNMLGSASAVSSKIIPDENMHSSVEHSDSPIYTISITGLEQVERDEFLSFCEKHMVFDSVLFKIDLVAHFSKRMHLLLVNPSSPVNYKESVKFQSSIKWRIPAVNIDWLFGNILAKTGKTPNIQSYQWDKEICKKSIQSVLLHDKSNQFIFQLENFFAMDQNSYKNFRSTLLLEIEPNPDINNIRNDVANQNTMSQEQNSYPNNSSTSKLSSNLFSGLVFCVSKKLWHMRLPLQNAIEENGGSCLWHLPAPSSGTTNEELNVVRPTHYVFTFPRSISISQRFTGKMSHDVKQAVLALEYYSCPVIHPQWIFDCVEKNTLFLTAEYPCDLTVNAKRNRLQFSSPSIEPVLSLNNSSSQSPLTTSEPIALYEKQRQPSDITNLVDHLLQGRSGSTSIKLTSDSLSSYSHNSPHTELSYPSSDNLPASLSPWMQGQDIKSVVKQKFKLPIGNLLHDSYAKENNYSDKSIKHTSSLKSTSTFFPESDSRNSSSVTYDHDSLARTEKETLRKLLLTPIISQDILPEPKKRSKRA